jgi:hypothetical protein
MQAGSANGGDNEFARTSVESVVIAIVRIVGAVVEGAIVTNAYSRTVVSSANNRYAC